MTNQVHFKDFGKKRAEVSFTLGDRPEDKYICVPALSLPAIQELALIGGRFSNESAVDSFVEFFNLVMDEDSARRIEHKMRHDRMDPLDKDQAVAIMNWLLEVYGLRPTQPSSDSSSGSPNDGSGTPSEAGVSEA